MDIDDLMNEVNKIDKKLKEEKKGQLNDFDYDSDGPKRNTKTKKKEAYDSSDEWGTNCDPMKSGISKKKESESDDDWGDKTDKNKFSKPELLQLNDQQIVKSNKRPNENLNSEWEVYQTPILNKGKGFDLTNKVKNRKTEEDDDWGISPQSKPQLGGYYNNSTGTSIIYVQNTGSIINSQSKCFALIIGGSDLPNGFCEGSIHVKSCSSLRCFKCDKKVHRFINGQWHQSVDYLFVRNHNTNLEQLQNGLIFAPGYSSYACQCKFISTNQQLNAQDLQWMCGGH